MQPTFAFSAPARRGHQSCMMPAHRMRSLVARVLLAVLVLSVLAVPLGCAKNDEVRVFVRDPHAVWVEARTPSGTRVVLPAGHGFQQVSVALEHPAFSSLPPSATVFREGNGGITIDYAACGVSPYAPLHPSGELTVVPDVGARPADIVGSDGPNFRLAYRCHIGNGPRVLDMTLVTPWSNVKAIHEYEH